MLFYTMGHQCTLKFKRITHPKINRRGRLQKFPTSTGEGSDDVPSLVSALIIDVDPATTQFNDHSLLASENSRSLRRLRLNCKSGRQITIREHYTKVNLDSFRDVNCCRRAATGSGTPQ